MTAGTPLVGETGVEEVQAVLHAAVQLLEQDGWCQRQSVTGGGARCPIAAIAAAAGGAKATENRAHLALERWVIWHTQFESVSEWNDAPDRTKDEVLAGLRGATEELAA